MNLHIRFYNPVVNEEEKEVQVIDPILAIYDTDAEYAKALLSYWTRRPSFGYRITAFSEPEVLQEYLRRTEPEVLLCPEAFAKAAQGLSVKLVPMYEERARADANAEKGVFKYQSAEVILQWLFSNGFLRTGLNREAEMTLYGVLAARGGDGVTSLAAALAEGLTAETYEAQTVLLVSLDSLQTWRPYESSRTERQTARKKLRGGAEPEAEQVHEAPLEREPQYPLSELVYYHRQGVLTQEQSRELICTYGTFRLLAGVACFTDSAELSGEEVLSMLKQLAQIDGYRAIVIDFGEWKPALTALLEACDFLFAPYLTDVGNAEVAEMQGLGGKWSECARQLSFIGQDEAVKRIHMIALPFAPELRGQITSARVWGSEVLRSAAQRCVELAVGAQ